LAERISAQERTFPRSVSLDPVFAALLPEVLIGVTPERFAAIANRVLTPKTAPTLSVEHLHLPLVSVAAEAILVVAALRRHKTMTFRGLVADAPNTLVVVARFLSLLELYKDGSVRFEQLMALGELQITWTGAAEGEIAVSDEFDREPVLESNDESAAGQPEQRDN
jgi:segregation and condensation protein A